MTFDQFDLFHSEGEMGEYVFGILDNGGATADRLTVIFSDGSYLGLSHNPEHPQGVSMADDGSAGDILGFAHEGIEEGTHVALGWRDLPEGIRAHILRRVNEGFRDYIQDLTSGERPIPTTRAAATLFEGIMDSFGFGLYQPEPGVFWIKNGGDDPKDAEDYGPFATIREALRYTVPEHYSLSGPEYHMGGQATDDDEPDPERMAALAVLEAKEDAAYSADLEARTTALWGEPPQRA